MFPTSGGTEPPETYSKEWVLSVQEVGLIGLWPARGRPRAARRPRGRPKAAADRGEYGRLPSDGGSRSSSARRPRLVAFRITLRGGLDRPGVRDVERDDAAEARVADVRDGRVLAGGAARARSRSPYGGAIRASSVSRPSRQRWPRRPAQRRSRRSPRNWRSRALRSGSRVTVAPSSASWSRSGTSSPSGARRRRLRPARGGRRASRSSRRRRRGRRCARSASQSGIVSTGFAGASTQTRSASGRRAGLVVLDVGDAPAARAAAAACSCRSSALGERDRRSGSREREQHRRRRAHAGRIEQRVAAFAARRARSPRRRRRVVVARVVEASRLAVLVVRPDRRAVRVRHALTLVTGLTRGFASANVVGRMGEGTAAANSLVQSTLLGELFEHAHVGVVAADSGRYIAANEYACELTGYDRVGADRPAG